MGLDWLVHRRRPVKGSEARFGEVEQLLREIGGGDARSPVLEEEFDRISEDLFDVIGAPEVGKDPEADEWFRKQCYEPAHADAMSGEMRGGPERIAFWKQDFEKCLEKHKGQRVAELAKEQGGIASVTGMLASNLDFRGKMLSFLKGLDEDLVEESYEDHSAEQCLDYARRLEKQLSNVEDGEVLESAIAWLCFWGGRGFGYRAWF